MRIIKEVDHTHYKVSIFHSNQRYIVRFADGDVAIDLKMPQNVIENVKDVENIIRNSLEGKMEKHMNALHHLLFSLLKKEDSDDFPQLI